MGVKLLEDWGMWGCRESICARERVGYSKTVMQVWRLSFRNSVVWAIV